MEFLQPYLAPLCLLLVVLVIVQFFLIASLNSRFARLTKSLRTFFSTAGGEDIEELLRLTLEQSRESTERSNEAAQRLDALETVSRGCFQYIGMVRYDAFGDATGQQSFSMALIDARDNGVVLSALFGRSTSRCYGKLINEGQSQQALTEEEQEALLQALEQKVAKRR